MQTASLLGVKSLGLLLIIVAAVGCGSSGGSYQPPRYVSAYAPHPLNVEPPQHGAEAESTSTWISEPSPHAAYPPPATAQARGEPRRAPARPRRAAEPEDGGPTEWIDPGAPSPVPVREAVAVLRPTKGSHVSGVVRFREDGAMLDVIASVDGLTAGPHAYHVHVYGDCSAPDAESAGPHFHFTGSSFDERPRIITGNLGELHPDDRLTTVDRARVNASLQGRYSIIGRTVVVHAQGNDPTQPPDGAAGKRIACGVIGIANPGAGAPATADRRH